MIKDFNVQLVSRKLRECDRLVEGDKILQSRKTYKFLMAQNEEDVIGNFFFSYSCNVTI